MSQLKLRAPNNIIEHAMMNFAKRVATDDRFDTKPEWLPDAIYIGATKYDAIIIETKGPRAPRKHN